MPTKELGEDMDDREKEGIYLSFQVDGSARSGGLVHEGKVAETVGNVL